MVTIAAMRAHPEAIWNRHVATWDCGRWHEPKAITEWAVIETPPIRGARSYTAVMHEIGHCLGRYQHSQRCCPTRSGPEIGRAATHCTGHRRWSAPLSRRSTGAAIGSEAGRARAERNDRLEA